MEMEKKSLENVIEEVTKANNPYSGTLYTKEDVLRILGSIEEKSGIITDELISDLKSKVSRAIDNLDRNDIANGFQFEITNGNEIEVEDFDFNTSEIEDAVNSEIDGFFDDIK